MPRVLAFGSSGTPREITLSGPGPLITDAELDALERLAARATPGPWWVETGDGAYIAHGTRGDARATYDLLGAGRVETDYAYIAAVHPGVVQRLIAALRAARRWAPTGRQP